MSQSTLDDYQFAGEHPWRNKELMERLYLDEKMSHSEIAEFLDCGYGTVATWIREKHEIPTRSISEAREIQKGYIGPPFFVGEHGYERWDADGHTVNVHRLLAASEWGPEAVEGMHVHHKNEIPWDNRVENLELLSVGQHSARHHTKIDFVDRVRIAELYENGDISYRGLHDALDYDHVDWTTLMNIHKEFYGDK